MSDETKPKRKRYPKGQGPGKGNYPHKSRKGVEIKPHKGGKTQRFPTVWLTIDEQASFQSVLDALNLTPTAWVELHLKADADNLTEGSRDA